MLPAPWQDLHIVSTDEKQVFAAVQEWNQNDTYNLYLSDTRGIYFTLAMENVKTTRGIGGNQMLDLYEVRAWLHWLSVQRTLGQVLSPKRLKNPLFVSFGRNLAWYLKELHQLQRSNETQTARAVIRIGQLEIIRITK